MARVPDYGDRLKAHLEEYKRRVLGTEASGVWPSGESGRSYPHILAADDVRLNIVESARDAFWEYWASRSRTPHAPRLHRDFAHLNSSQAFAFNLFFPFLNGGADGSRVLLNALGIDDEPIAEWEFEKVLDEKERTNFDVWMRLASGLEVCVEVKLTEREFGFGVPDAARMRKLAELYSPALRSRVPESELEPAAFFRRYQILRNAMYAEDGRRIILFVFPHQNSWLREGERYIEQIARGSSSIRCIHTEDFVDALLIGAEGSLLLQHPQLVVEKYMIAATEGYPLPASHPCSKDDFHAQLDAVFGPGDQVLWVSVVALLPNPPEQPFSAIGRRLLGTGSPTRFLTHLFCELVSPTRDRDTRVVIDGFLGSAGSAQSPWILLPVIGTWLRSPAAVTGAVARFADVWNTQLERGEASVTALPSRLDVDMLAPFVPNGRVLNATLAQRFVDDALAVLRGHPQR